MLRLMTVTITLLACVAQRAAADGAFDGEWRTSIGTVSLKQSGVAVTGTYGATGQFSLKGAVRGKELKFEYQEGNATGEAHWTLDDSGTSFHGGYQVRGGQAGAWDGWRPDPQAVKGKAANV